MKYTHRYFVYYHPDTKLKTPASNPLAVEADAAVAKGSDEVKVNLLKVFPEIKDYLILTAKLSDEGEQEIFAAFRKAGQTGEGRQG